MNNFRELVVWQKSMQFVKDFYLISNQFPQSELYGLTAQCRRSSFSIPSNIAEGAGRSSNKQFSNFINIAIGSAFELECQIQIAYDLEFMSQNNFEKLNQELKHIQNMLIKLKQSLDK